MPARPPFPELLEPLEPRIAPAIAVVNPLPDITVGPYKTGADIDLSRMLDQFVTDNGHTIVTLTTNLDTDTFTPGIQPGPPIVIELLDDLAPLSVQNFLSYLTNPDPKSNYVGTFFHRASPGFVLQGGGFDVGTPDTHIPTPFAVHNEFDPARSNIEGTIAIAKTGLGPNTGTSEWFINLSDNSSNLDNQNGGFTVFAIVRNGLNVAKVIASLSLYNPGNDGSGVPVQNYDPDPDQNPNTPIPVPTADQRVVITGYTITPPPSGNVSGITYSLSAVTDAVTGLPSDLVTGSTDGAVLHLNYKAHAAGVVNLTVRADDGNGSTAEDTFTVNLQPNLVSSFVGDSFEPAIIGGDLTTAPIVIGNTGGGWAVGNVDVKVYLSKIGGVDPSGVIVEPDRDVLIGSFVNVPIDIAGGATTTLMKTLQIPRQLVTTTGEVYRVLVQVAPSDGVIVERFSDDNVSFDSNVHDWENGFGTFSVTGYGKRKNAVLTYVEPDGDVVSFGLTKGSGGRVAFDGTFADLSVVTARPGAVLSAKVVTAVSSAKGDIDLENVDLFQFMDRVNLSKVALSGSFSAAQGVRQLFLGDVSGGGLITLGAFPADQSGKPSITFKRVADFGIESLIGIKAIRAIEWLDTGGAASVIRAPFIKSLLISGRPGDVATSVRGDFQANVNVTGEKGLSVLDVAGYVKDATIFSAGNVGTVDVGGLDHAKLFVGVNSLPTDASGFAVTRSIDSLTVHGVAGELFAIIDSDVAAARMGAVSVKRIDGASGNDSFGIVADVIRSYNRGKSLSVESLKTPQVFDRVGHYSVRIL